MKRETSLTILLLVAVVLPVTGQGLPTPGGSRVAEQDSRLSSIYANQAMTAIREKDWVTAEGLIGVALQFNPSNSDALFERGTVLEQEPGGIEGAISAFEAALAAGQWSVDEPDACRLDLGALLYRTKRYAEAVAALAKMGTTDSADWLYLSARSLEGEKRTAAASRMLEQAIHAYPNDYQFVVERVRIDSAYRIRLAERYLAKNNVGYLPPEVLREIIVDTPQAKQKQKLIDIYNLRFSPSTTVLGESLLAAEMVSDAQINQFVAAGGLKDGGLAEQLYASLKTPKSKAYFADSVAKFSGTSDWDTNRDGFAEQTVVYASGRIVRLVVDNRQNGLPEFDVQFQNSLPRTVIANHGGIEYHIAYGEYPYVQSVDFTQGDLKTTYTLEPNSFALSLFEPSTEAFGQLPSGSVALPTSLLFPRLAAPPPEVSRDLLFGRASTVEEDNLALKQPVTFFKLGLDDILKKESDWEKGSYRYLVEYRGKEKVLGLRDINDNGKFDVAEYYKHGKLVRLTYDPKHDGKPLFWIDFSASYPILYWDYNGDGVPDAIEKQISPTKTLVEISTKLNGVFDIRTDEVTK